MPPASQISLHHIGSNCPNALHRVICLNNELSPMVSSSQHWTSGQSFLQLSICFHTFRKQGHTNQGNRSCQFRKWGCHSTDCRDESLVITSKAQERPHIRLSLGPLKSHDGCHLAFSSVTIRFPTIWPKIVHTQLKFPDRFPPCSNTSAPNHTILVALPIQTVYHNFFCVGWGDLQPVQDSIYVVLKGRGS